jgi:hypothetical protein
MKVYVVKNDKNEYMTETGDFINSLWQAELFYDYECAYCYAPSGCNIVECSLMEKYQLAEHDKQVRNEMCEEVLLIIDEKFNCCGYIEEKFEYIKKYVLDQIQGENND